MVSGSNNATSAWPFSGTGSGISNYLSQNSSGGGWRTWTNCTGANLAFELNGTIETVPEPATFALGLVLLPLLKRGKSDLFARSMGFRNTAAPSTGPEWASLNNNFTESPVKFGT